MAPLAAPPLEMPETTPTGYVDLAHRSATPILFYCLPESLLGLLCFALPCLLNLDLSIRFDLT